MDIDNFALFQRFLSNPHPPLRYFTALELLLKITNRPSNSAPPIELWNNILPTVYILDELRHRLGCPIRLSSGYRNKAYNRQIGGVRNSMHVQFNALDFKARRGRPKDWANELKAMRSEGFPVGGIGIYTDDNFVHLDTRCGHGKPYAVWGN